MTAYDLRLLREEGRINRVCLGERCRKLLRVWVVHV